MTFLLHDARGARRGGVVPVASEPERARRRLWRADLLQAAAVVSVAVALALWLVDGGLASVRGVGDVATALGIATGLAATDLVLVMLLLAARVPLVEQTFGQDTAMRLHSRLGKPVVLLLVAHAVLLVIGYAVTDRVDLVAEAVSLWNTPDIPLAVLGLALFGVIVVSSLVAVRRRFRYETWHLVHLLVYGAVLASLPHQFSVGGIFAAGTWQRWYWLAITACALAAILVYRFWLPVWRSARHALRVVAVEPIAADVLHVRMRGRDLERLAAHGGQFFVWRFLARGQWWQAHPYSLSAAPGGDELRITVRALGDGSASLTGIRPGVRVAIEGPYGVFSEVSRSRRRVAFVAAGIGVTPVRSLLESAAFRPGEATVVLRTPEADRGWLLDEFRDLCRRRGATLITAPGARGGGWLPAAAERVGFDLAALVPELADTDVYVCGPRDWAEAVLRDARAAGVRPEQLHHERFDW